VNYRRSVEALIPGVQGRVLGVLARTETEMTIRTVASLADASPQQATVVVTHLVDLGVVSRREAGSSSLVRLERENEAARVVLALARLQESTMDRLTDVARHVVPVPVSLIVFGSFARGEADTESDLDILAVRSNHVDADDNEWIDSLGRWEVDARKIVGNPVNMMVVSFDEVPALLRRRSGPWRTIAREGIPLLGSPLSELASVA
jgi:predicted nucleotidyltransferase